MSKIVRLRLRHYDFTAHPLFIFVLFFYFLQNFITVLSQSFGESYKIFLTFASDLEKKINIFFYPLPFWAATVTSTICLDNADAIVLPSTLIIVFTFKATSFLSNSTFNGLLNKSDN